MRRLKRRQKTLGMKSQIIEKNGFLKPLGLILIIIVLSLTCFINLVFADDTTVPDPNLLTEETAGNVPDGMTVDGTTALPYSSGL